jgi:hypothetical protein
VVDIELLDMIPCPNAMPWMIDTVPMQQQPNPREDDQASTSIA